MSIYPTLRYDDAKAAIRFLVDAFGFTEKSVMENDDGTIAHAELAWPGGGLVMLGQRRAEPSPFDTGRTVTYLALDDPDAHHARAVKAGAEIVQELVDQDYGSREYAASDPEGNVWSFGTYRP
ncbi:VOC family protein [Virgisporangium ochraceum]|jgi:uncharacterized glyoxalase superfamily protein PhnB|uniref:VOC domain-containing protein n=1 Tax=Virgisporangium ochraceum TaxID=65505 RepID=A0A8J3ZMD4_9ACTN|nr:VOC family protein [Virgisporangium ochraceum]GIJ66494.1 hypothetical protein Voc01_014110 [Virgisporangium ochraceum]